MQQISLTVTLAVTSFILGLWLTNTKPVTSSASMTPLDLGSTTVASRPPSVSTRPAADGLYYFTMQLPESAGKPFAQLSFTEQSRSQGATQLQFDLSKTKVFVGTPDAVDRAIALKGAWIDETGTFWVELNPSVPPKTTLTIALKPQQQSSGISYDFGIAAYPDTNYPVAVYVGNGTLTVK